MMIATVDLTVSERYVLNAIAGHLNTVTGVAEIPLDDIATQAFVCRRQAIRVVQALEEKGLLTVERFKHEGGINAVNRYRVEVSP